METAAVGSNAVISMNREDTPNLTVQNMEMKEDVTVAAGTNTQNAVPQCTSIQPICLADSTNAIINDVDVINCTLSSNLMNADNSVPLSVANEINICDQAIFNYQPVNSVTGSMDNSVQTVSSDVNNRLEIAANLDISGQQSECDTLSTVGHVILVSADEGCSTKICDVGELSSGIDTKDSLNSGEMNANFQVGMNTVRENDTNTNKEGNEINYTSEKADKDNVSEKFYGIHKDNSDINECSRNDNHEVESGNTCNPDFPAVPVMVHQACQTDLEECVEDADGLRFCSVAQKPVVVTPTVVGKPAPVISKTVVTGRSPVASPRIGVRTASLAASVRPQPLVRPAYAAVSKLSNQASTRSQSLSHSSPTSTKPYSSPQLVRSRTSTDVRSAGRGTMLRKLPAERAAAVLKSQRATLVSRQVRNCNCLNCCEE
jgi:hypothetical protein